MHKKWLSRVLFSLLALTLVFTGCQPRSTDDVTPGPEDSALKEERFAAMTAEQLQYHQLLLAPYADYGVYRVQYNNGFYLGTDDGNVLDLLGRETIADLRAEHGDKFPGDVVEQLFGAFVPLSPEELREAAGNQYESGTYTYSRSPDEAPLYYEVITDIAPGDWVTLYCDGYSEVDNRLVYRHNLTFEIVDGNPVILINQVLPVGADSTPLIERFEYDEGDYYLLNEDGTWDIQGFSTNADLTVGKLMEEVAGQLSIVNPAWNTIRQDKGMVRVDFTGEFVGRLSDATTERRFLNSLAMTVVQNSISAEYLIYSMDGEDYVSANLTLSKRDAFEIEPLNLGDFTADDFTALRQTVPFQWPQWVTDTLEGDDWYIIPVDGVTKQITNQLRLIGRPGTDILTPGGFTDQYKIEQALLQTNLYSTTSFYGDEDPLFKPEFLPIAIEVEDAQFSLKEDVEEAVRRIFGPDVTVQHQTVGRWTWHPTAGVYTPPHMGGGGAFIPAVLSYEDLGDRYECVVSYALMGMGSYIDEEGNPIADSEVVNFVWNTAIQYNVVFLKGDGQLIIQSIVQR